MRYSDMLVLRPYVVCCTILAGFVVHGSGYTPAELQEMYNHGLKDIQSETIDGPVTLEHGSIPTWLSGQLLGVFFKIHVLFCRTFDEIMFHIKYPIGFLLCLNCMQEFPD